MLITKQPMKKKTLKLYKKKIITPIGVMIAMATDEAICVLDFFDQTTWYRDQAEVLLRLEAKDMAQENALLLELEKQLKEYFTKERKEFDALITLDDKESFTSTKNLLLGAFNHAYFGGGIRFVPSATQGSHHFQIAIARKVSLFTVLKAFPFILTNGTHFKLFPKNLKEYSCTKANIKINEPIKAQKDGEFVTYPTVNLNLSMDHYPFLLT